MILPNPLNRLQGRQFMCGSIYASVGTAVAAFLWLAIAGYGGSHGLSGAASLIAPAQAQTPAQPQGGAPAKQMPSAANAFNRLMKKPASAAHAAPPDDGIHDPENSGTHLLQWPSEAFQSLPTTNDGNRVDWVKALEEGLIAPRYELEDPDAEVFTMDLVIVREVKGSMPDVVYPHLQHTEWLDCTNCHDEIFVPAKGENQISMAAILLGQKCGACHGKVAFPVTDCRRCHSKPKSDEQLRALAEKSAWQAKPSGTKKQ